MAENKKLTGYEVEKAFIELALKQPNRKPIHFGLFYWISSLNNRLNWTDEFGLPTDHTMEVLGIKNYRTYKATLVDLESWGAIEVIEWSKNQYTSTTVKITLNNCSGKKVQSIVQSIVQSTAEALPKAITKAKPKQSQSTVQSIATINKPTNQQPSNHKPKTKEVKENILFPDEKKEIELKFGKSQFLELFNKLKMKARNSKRKTSAISDNAEKNLNKLIAKGMKKPDFEIAIKEMLKADWPIQTKNDNPEHVLIEKNFFKYHAINEQPEKEVEIKQTPGVEWKK